MCVKPCAKPVSEGQPWRRFGGSIMWDQGQAFSDVDDVPVPHSAEQIVDLFVPSHHEELAGHAE